MALTPATIRNMSAKNPDADVHNVDVMFNPTEYTIDRAASYADQTAPGLPLPILQFVRGDTQTLRVELYLDGSNTRESIAPQLEKLRYFIRIDPDLHAPPVARFEWGDHMFQGVVTSLSERFQMFAEDGKPLRARVTVTFKRYQAAGEQLVDLKKSSPDRTHVRVVREGETLAQIAYELYGDPRQWRVIAEENDIDRPRFVPVGTPLKVPAT